MKKRKKIFAHLISIGDELLIGQVIDTNSAYISKELNKIGVEVTKISSISDTEKDILETVNQSTKKAHIIITTGGLGPTKDDITKHSLAKLFGKKMVYHSDVFQHIEKLFSDKNLKINEYTKSQAELPKNTKALHNEIGTAPGMWTKYKKCIVINLPGVPNEMKKLMTEQVLPKIKKQFNTPFIIHKTILSIGVPESILAERLHDFEINLPKNIKLAYLPNGTKIRLRLSGYGKDDKILENLLLKKENELINLLGENYQSYNEDPIEKQLFDVLKKNNLKISTAESCTGGAISKKIVSQQGISDFFMGGLVAYSNKIKINLLNIDTETLRNHGAVSEQTVKEMAIQCAKLFNSDIAIASSGIAPSQKISNEDCGKVFLAVYFKDKVEIYFYHLKDKTRQEFINTVAEIAINNTLKLLAI